MARRFSLGVLLVVVAVVATGCLRMNVDIDVTDDGSGSIDVILAADVERFGLFSDLAEDLGDELGDDLDADVSQGLCDEFTADSGFNDVPEGAVVEPYDEDGFCGERLRYDFPAGTDVGATLEAAFGDVNDGPLTIEKQGDEWVFDAAIDAQLDDVDDLGDDELGAGFAELLFGDAEFEWRVTMPGRPVDGAHNADRVEGNTFIWDLDLFDPEPRLFARTEPGSVGAGLWRWIVLGAMVAAVAVLGVLLLRRRNASADPSGGSVDAGRIGESSTPVMGSSIDGATAEDAPFGAMPLTPPVAPAEPDPQWDDALGAWVFDDPVRGRLVHDEATGQWRPAG